MPPPRRPTTDRHLVVWGTWGAYHRARFAAYRDMCEADAIEVHGLELFRFSADYAWPRASAQFVTSLDLGGDEATFPGFLALRPALRYIRHLRPSAVFLPAYHHWSLALNLLARMSGARVVIMSDTTAVTAKPGLARRLARTAAVRTAGAMLVGGAPHRRYFAALGVPTSRIFEGYDAVDNVFFERAAAAARRVPGEVRRTLGVAGPFYLAIARLVPKKSLETLLDAYALVRESPTAPPGICLVIIGSGPLKPELERQAGELGIPLGPSGLMFVDTFDEEKVASAMGLADALVLPSTAEEWGLVVNEAMASGCPVVVSRAVGCVEDLVEDGVTGLLFDPLDAKGLAAQLIAIAGDGPMRVELVTAATQRIAHWGCDRFAHGALLAAKASQARRPRLPRVGSWLRDRRSRRRPRV